MLRYDKARVRALFSQAVPFGLCGAAAPDRGGPGRGGQLVCFVKEGHP